MVDEAMNKYQVFIAKSYEKENRKIKIRDLNKKLVTGGVGGLWGP